MPNLISRNDGIKFLAPVNISYLHISKMMVSMNQNRSLLEDYVHQQVLLQTGKTGSPQQRRPEVTVCINRMKNRGNQLDKLPTSTG